MVTKHEKTRQKLWIKAWVEVAGAVGCTTPSIATRYADRALEAFDERFKEKIEVAKPKEGFINIDDDFLEQHMK